MSEGRYYEKYTERFQDTKSIQLGLKPVEKTAEAIEKKKYHDFDQAVHDKINAILPVVDAWAIDLVGKALEKFEYPYDEFGNDIARLRECKPGSDEYPNVMRALSERRADFSTRISEAIAMELPEEIASKKNDLTKLLSAALIKKVLPEYAKRTSNTSFDHTEAYLNLQALSNATSSVLPRLKHRQTALETSIPEREAENFEIYDKNTDIIKKLMSAENAPELSRFFNENAIAKSFAIKSGFELCLTQAGIDGYNRIIGGIVNENGIVSKGLNMIINEMNMKNRQDKGYRGPFYPRLEALKKLPLVPREKQYVFETITNDDEVKEIVEQVVSETSKKRREIMDMLERRIADAHDGLYAVGKNAHAISHILCGEHDVLPKKLEERYVEELKAKNGSKKITKKLQEKIDKASVTVRGMTFELTDLEKVAGADILKAIYNRMMSLHMSLSSAEPDLSFNRIKGNRKAQGQIQQYYDLLKDFKDTAYILVTKSEEADPLFYNEYNELVSGINNWVRTETRVAAYITKKPRDMASAVSCYFGYMPRMENEWWHMNGKDVEKFEKKNFTILQKDGRYYYFILADDAKAFVPKEAEEGEDFYLMRSQKKPPKGAMMDIPKFIFAMMPVKAKEFFEREKTADTLTREAGFSTPFTVTRRQYEIYKSGLHKKSVGDIEAAREYMRMVKDFISKADIYAEYDFSSLRPVEEYACVNDLSEDIDKCCLDIRDVKISASQIDSLVDSGDALMFLIYNRNLYEEGAKLDKFAALFVGMMSDENKKLKTMQLNSRPTVRYRAPVIEKDAIIIHKKGSWLLNRRDRNGSPMPSAIYEELYKFKNNKADRPLSDRAKEYLDHDLCVFKQADHDIIKDGRYASEMYSLNISYIMNRKAAKKDMRGHAPDRIWDRIAADDNGICLSIRRSAYDLLYYSVIDKDGKVLEEKSLNIINGYNFMEKLRTLTGERRDEKKQWNNDKAVKDLKAGYCSDAITEIVRAAIRHNVTRIYCEKISDRYKDKYSCIDNQVFKGFEDKLASRLASIHLKDAAGYDKGGIYNPIQLADNAGGKAEDGVLEYVNSSYIDMMDPDTGFQPLFKLGNIRTVAQKRDFFAAMDSITASSRRIVLDFDYDNFNTGIETKKTAWKVTIAKPVRTYDREHKAFVTVEHPAQEIFSLITPAQEGDIDLKAMLNDLPGKVIDMLWYYFRLTLGGRTVEGGVEYYTSPVTGRRYVASSKNARLQAIKAGVMREYYKNAGDIGDENPIDMANDADLAANEEGDGKPVKKDRARKEHRKTPSEAWLDHAQEHFGFCA